LSLEEHPDAPRIGATTIEDILERTLLFLLLREREEAKFGNDIVILTEKTGKFS
jgi:hypothetical protein